jgi:Ca-activated chloride channel family protein
MSAKDWYITIILIAVNVAVGALYLFGRNWYEYESPMYFWGLLLVPILSLGFVFTYKKNSGKVAISSIHHLDSVKESWLIYFRHGLIVPRLLAVALMLMAAARPQSKTSYEDLTKEGIDIILSMDLSGSMLSKDFRPNRLESAKDVAADFISERHDDRIGVVVYEGESFTQVPLTTDHRVVKEAILTMQTGLIEGGTAIGMGLATAVNRLKTSEAKSKVVILLTDGVNNAGEIKPIDAARIAEAFKVRVYTIGVGTQGEAMTPVAQYPNGEYKYEMRKVEIDEDVLKKIAKMTGGEYFRATSKEKLKGIYKEIDKLEKTKFNVTQYSQRTEEFFWFAFWAIVLLTAEFALRNTILRTTP